MIGRAAIDDPYLFAGADRRFFGASSRRSPAAARSCWRWLPLLERWLARGQKLQTLVRHTHGLFAGQRGARVWRRAVSEGRARSGGRPGLPAWRRSDGHSGGGAPTRARRRGRPGAQAWRVFSISRWMCRRTCSRRSTRAVASTSGSAGHQEIHFAVDDLVGEVVKIGHLLGLAAIAVNGVDLLAEPLHGFFEAALELGGKADLQTRGGGHRRRRLQTLQFLG